LTQDLTEKVLEEVIDHLHSPQPPQPTGEDREDQTRYFVPNILIPAEADRLAEAGDDRDDDR
jgi:hypothetical protein